MSSNTVFFFLGSKKNKAQSFVEYALLITVGLIAFFAVANSMLDGKISNSFLSHFNTAKGHISGN